MKKRNLQSKEGLVKGDRFRFKDRFGGNNGKMFIESSYKMNLNRYFNQNPSHQGLRPQILEWMIFICKKLNYSRRTHHYAVAYMDAIFSLCKAKEKEIKLIVFICIYIAAKLEEKDKNIPYIHVILN